MVGAYGIVAKAYGIIPGAHAKMILLAQDAVLCCSVT